MNIPLCLSNLSLECAIFCTFIPIAVFFSEGVPSVDVIYMI